MRGKIAAVEALQHLAVNHWADPTASPIAIQARASVVASTSEALLPWVQVAGGQISPSCPPMLPSQSFYLQMEQIKKQAAWMADVMAKGLSFFSQEWCICLSSNQFKSTKRMQSPNARRHSIGSAAGTTEEEQDEYPSRDTLLSIFTAIDAIFEALEEKHHMQIWASSEHTLLGTSEYVILVIFNRGQSVLCLGLYYNTCGRMRNPIFLLQTWLKFLLSFS